MFTIRKAERRKAKLRLAICGVSGSGKTYSALKIAKGIGGRVCIIDTENGSADLYSNEFEYDVIDLCAPYTLSRYIEAIKAAEDEGFDVIIIDSLSHAWAGEGGALDMQEKEVEKQRVKNSYTAWAKVTKDHNALINAILGSKCHIIGTMRSKQAYEIVNDAGKSKPVKLGLAPIQREGMEYEFTVVFDIGRNHYAISSKDRTNIFGESEFIPGENDGVKLLSWLNTGRDEEAETLATVLDITNDFRERCGDCSSVDELKILFSESWLALKAHEKYKEAADSMDSIKKLAASAKEKLISKNVGGDDE